MTDNFETPTTTTITSEHQAILALLNVEDHASFKWGVLKFDIEREKSTRTITFPDAELGYLHYNSRLNSVIEVIRDLIFLIDAFNDQLA